MSLEVFHQKSACEHSYFLMLTYIYQLISYMHFTFLGVFVWYKIEMSYSTYEIATKHHIIW